jgi:hypothetical protein
MLVKITSSKMTVNNREQALAPIIDTARSSRIWRSSLLLLPHLQEIAILSFERTVERNSTDLTDFADLKYFRCAPELKPDIVIRLGSHVPLIQYEDKS